MHPHTPTAPGVPAEPLPIAQVNTGMTVVDADGEQAGTVAAVQQPGTDVRPDLPAGIAEHLMGTGYLRVDATGLLSTDSYVGGDDVAGVTEGSPGIVRLTVRREELPRSA